MTIRNWSTCDRCSRVDSVKPQTWILSVSWKSWIRWKQRRVFWVALIVNHRSEVLQSIGLILKDAFPTQASDGLREIRRTLRPLPSARECQAMSLTVCWRLRSVVVVIRSYCNTDQELWTLNCQDKWNVHCTYTCIHTYIHPFVDTNFHTYIHTYLFACSKCMH